MCVCVCVCVCVLQRSRLAEAINRSLTEKTPTQATSKVNWFRCFRRWGLGHIGGLGMLEWMRFVPLV